MNAILHEHVLPSNSDHFFHPLYFSLVLTVHEHLGRYFFSSYFHSDSYAFPQYLRRVSRQTDLKSSSSFASSPSSFNRPIHSCQRSIFDQKLWKRNSQKRNQDRKREGRNHEEVLWFARRCRSRGGSEKHSR